MDNALLFIYRFFLCYARFISVALLTMRKSWNQKVSAKLPYVGPVSDKKPIQFETDIKLSGKSELTLCRENSWTKDYV